MKEVTLDETLRQTGWSFPILSYMVDLVKREKLQIDFCVTLKLSGARVKKKTKLRLKLPMLDYATEVS